MEGRKGIFAFLNNINYYSRKSYFALFLASHLTEIYTSLLSVFPFPILITNIFLESMI